MGIVEELTDRLGRDAVLTDEAALSAHRRDAAGLAPAGTPLAVVRPATTREVTAVVEAARRHRVAVVPRGAGTGLAGAANALDGSIVLSLARMDRIVSVDTDALTAVAQAGVLTIDLARRVAEEGLWYPPDPASWDISTIGGNVAANAGGMCCVKYGVTRDYVLGLEAVLADGAVLRAGARTVKSVAGYDLVGLLVGSEGTLGIVTEVTVRLRPAPPPATTLVAAFPRLTEAGDAISAVTRRMTPSMLEIIDAVTLAAIRQVADLPPELDGAALVVAQSDLAGAPGREEIAVVADVCEDAGATLVRWSDDPGEADRLLDARRRAYPALEGLGDTVLDDVAVPRDRVTAMIEATGRIAEQRGLVIGTFGHAGDGNLHPTIVFDAEDDAQVEAARGAFDDLVDAALALGGTITGEHGVGLLKRPHLPLEVGDVGMRVQRAIKDALDPVGILNPGKVL